MRNTEDELLPVMTSGGGGSIAAFTYPAYCGLAAAAGDHVPPEHRGLITWHEDPTAAGGVFGYAAPLTPRGVYGYLHYFSSPDGPATVHAAFDHPIAHRGGPLGGPSARGVAPIIYDPATGTLSAQAG